MQVFESLFFCVALWLLTAVIASESESKAQERELRRKDAPFARGMVIVRSTLSMDDTYNNLIEALDANDAITIFSEIDHAGAATEAGLELLPNKLVVFGNPTLGSPIMEGNPLAGLDLPQKVLVWQDSVGRVFLGYNPPEYLVSLYRGVRGVETLDTVGNALRNFASVATGVAVEDIKDPNKRQLNKIIRNRELVVSVLSNADFEATWTRLTNAIDSADGPTIFFTVDHGANSGGILTNGLRLVVFGNPNIGTPIMAKSATAGIDLPLKILVSEAEDGKVYVSTSMILGLRHGEKRFGLEPDLAIVRNAVNNFMNIAAGQETAA